MPRWTKDQQTAIDDRGGALLVSAAAGSGKTAVLVERVLTRLTDPDDPVDIDRLLLVTFTNAAAAEMRARIAAALSAAVAAAPQDARLRRQLFLVHRAKITTVHALCLSLAREQAAALGIAPDFRLMDENEGKLLRNEVLEEVLDAAYERGDAGFFALCDLLTAGRDDKRLGEVLLGTYEKLQAHPDPHAFLATVREGLYARGMDTPHGRVLRTQAQAAAEHGAAFLRAAIEAVTGIDALADTYLPALTSDLHRAEALLDALRGGDWDSCVAAARSIAFDRLKAARGFEDKAFLEQIKAMREEWKDAAKAIRDKWLTVTAAEAETDRGLTAPALAALCDLVEGFDAAFAAAKRARNAADFNDLEHFAVRLLYDGDRPSALARTLSAGYAEIAVDEYQDTNAVQDAIFRALSQDEKNLFMVGDVKQSIYGFRLADPSIFLSKYRTFADAADAPRGAPRRVILGRNFRSRAAVLDACNELFAAVMGETVGGLAYTDREALHLGATDYPDADDPRYRTEVLLVDAAGLSEDDDAPDKTALEARLAAQRIRALLDEGFPVADRATGGLRPVTPGDIVILLRSPRTKARAFIAALEQVGISAGAEERGGLLETAEVGTMVSLLSVIDNPRQDVDLIGVLRSPLFGFSEQELAEIRLVDRKAGYYDALCAARHDFPKVELFLQQLDDLRAFACDQPVYRLLWEIYDRTGALGLYGALPNGAQRQAGLLAFFERARSFEGKGFRGLFAFVRLLRGMQQTGEDFQTVGAETTGGAVRIMSIHKSKGLEFPVVLVADQAKRFNEADLREPILIHQSLGFGPKCRDRARGVQYDTVERTATAVLQRREMVSEELRVLYVALTRAKEKLILTGVSGSLQRSLEKWARLAALDTLPQYAMGAVRSPLAWIVAPLLRSPCTRALRAQYGLDVPERGTTGAAFDLRVLQPDELTAPAAATVVRFTEPDTADYVVQPYLDYPHAYLSALPSKLTATGVGHSYRAEEAAEQTRPPRRAPKLRAPLFEQGARRLTPAEVGTAHHLFMQFCDMAAAAAPGGVQRELTRLADRRILSPAQAAAIDIATIERFFASALYRELIACSPVRREFKFSVLVPAARFFPVAADAPDEKVLLQGVIDCLIDTPEGLVIVDFKTDRVTGAALEARAASYRPQLEAYALAVQAVYDRPAVRRLLYFFRQGRVWEA
ncbi:MAG: helicase-exonuclease AddAB subunit AddA [Eubacteriales bacterium]|nr:helicase-exonuclease AddAB subunit AddA [Eubacteriales bacterium]